MKGSFHFIKFYLSMNESVSPEHSNGCTVKVGLISSTIQPRIFSRNRVPGVMYSKPTGTRTWQVTMESQIQPMVRPQRPDVCFQPQLQQCHIKSVPFFSQFFTIYFLLFKGLTYKTNFSYERPKKISSQNFTLTRE